MKNLEQFRSGDNIVITHTGDYEALIVNGNDANSFISIDSGTSGRVSSVSSNASQVWVMGEETLIIVPNKYMKKR